jgi:hypothetical protein
MKRLIIILFCLLSLNVFSQTDTVKVPQVELDEIIAVIDTLVTQDSINNILIGQQDQQIKNFMFLAEQDSMIIDFKNQEIMLLNDRIDIYADQMKKDQKWYNKRQFGFIVGVLSTIGIIHIIDYTLP